MRARSYRLLVLVLVVLGAALLAVGCGGDSGSSSTTAAGGSGDKTLRIIGWEGYTDESITAAFEEKTGWKVVPTYTGSSDEMYSKISAGGGSGYDLVTASGDLTKRLWAAGLVEPIDVTKVENYKELFPIFEKPPWVTFDGQTYGVAIGWGPDFLIYNTDTVPEEPTSWKILYDEKYKGKVGLPDYPIFIADIALWNGEPDVYNLDQATLDKLQPELFALAPQVRKFWTSQGELSQLFMNKEVDLAWGWPGTIVELQQNGFPVGYTVPKEGATGWSDSWMIMKGSPNVDIAMQWIDFYLTAEIQRAMLDATGYWPVSKLAEPLLTADEKAAMHLTGDIADMEAYYAQIRFWETVDNYDAWTALWTNFRSTK